MNTTIRNDFHNSEATVRMPDNGILSESVVRRVRHELCGFEGCTCGGDLSQRGRQDVEIEPVGDGRVKLHAR